VEGGIGKKSLPGEEIGVGRKLVLVLFSGERSASRAFSTSYSSGSLPDSSGHVDRADANARRYPAGNRKSSVGGSLMPQAVRQASLGGAVLRMDIELHLDCHTLLRDSHEPRGSAGPRG
jgi:hypothetical protein